MKAWPFLLSANLDLDYTHVVVPDFAKQNGAVREISRASADFEHGAGEAIYLKGYHADVGVVDMLFREVQATQRMLGHDSDAVLTDKFNRPIRVFEGFVFRDRLPDGQLHFTREQLNAAHHAVEERFREFWEAGKDAKVFTISEFMELPAAAGEKLHLKLHESPNLRPPPLLAEPAKPATENLAKKLPKSAPSKTAKDLRGVGGNLDKLAVFAVVTGVALGAAYLLYRYANKTKAKPHGFTERVRQERHPSPSDVIGRTR